VEVYVSQLFLLLMCLLGRIHYTAVPLKFLMPQAPYSLTISVNHIHKFVTTRRALWAQLAPSFKSGIRETNKIKIECMCKIIKSKTSFNSSKNKFMPRKNIKEKKLCFIE
jgi:hypothetical protein